MKELTLLQQTRETALSMMLINLSEKVPTLDTQRDLTAHKGAYTRCPCTHSNGIGPYHSREAHKRYLWPRDMAVNEHQLSESSDR